MIPPNLLGLPILPGLDFVFYLLLLVLKVLLTWHCASLVAILEDVLAFGHNLVALELPEDCSAIITATCEKCTDNVPADTVYWLLVIGELRKFSDTFHFLFVVECFHCGDVRTKCLLIILCLNLRIQVNILCLPQFRFQFFSPLLPHYLVVFEFPYQESHVSWK